MSLSRGLRPTAYITKDLEALRKMRKGQVKSVDGGDTPTQSKIVGNLSDWPAEGSAPGSLRSASNLLGDKTARDWL